MHFSPKKLLISVFNLCAQYTVLSFSEWWMRTLERFRLILKLSYYLTLFLLLSRLPKVSNTKSNLSLSTGIWQNLRWRGYEVKKTFLQFSQLPCRWIKILLLMNCTVHGIHYSNNSTSMKWGGRCSWKSLTRRVSCLNADFLASTCSRRKCWLQKKI